MFAPNDQFPAERTGSKLGPVMQPYLPLALALPDLTVEGVVVVEVVAVEVVDLTQV